MLLAAFDTRVETLRSAFTSLSTKEAIYLKIIAWGNRLPPFDPAWQTDHHLVAGCQSRMYLHTHIQEGLLHFAADSDALISKGLASLLIFLYTAQSATTILQHPPLFFKELSFDTLLSPGRSNGFAGLYRRMQFEAAKTL